VHETAEDLRALDELIARSHARAGPHLRRIWSDERRIPAAELPELLAGVQQIDLATVTARAEPRVAPVDALFYRGSFWFFAARDSARYRHIRARPQVSAAHTRGQELAVVVHGRAREVDLGAPEAAGYAACCREARPDAWATFGHLAAHVRIDAERMFTFRAGPA
jgi:nitroimidazol reductase NimA-like FMN-containing flavoprotein (pyridoxamine 5'-phosphate oxidase superfamily)